MSLTPPNLEVALGWAAAGIPVFPCRARDEGGGRKAKTPLVRWKDEATTDPGQISAWWAVHPDALPGLLTRDLLVIDCDLRPDLNGVVAFESFARDTGLQLDGATQVRTPSGGEHLIWRLDRPVGVGNRTGALPKGVDVRSEGRGYVIAEGSVLPDGRRYDRVSGPDPRSVGQLKVLSLPPSQLIEALLSRPSPDVSSPPPHPKPGNQPLGEDIDFAGLDLSQARLRRVAVNDDERRRNRGLGILDCLAGDLAVVREGERGFQLFKIGCRAGRFVGGGAIEYNDAYRVLFEACEQNGLVGKDGAESVDKGVRRALETGMRKPLALADRKLENVSSPPPVANDNGSAPVAACRWTFWGDKPPAPRDWLLGRAIPKRGVVQVVGHSQAGKSAYVLRLAAHVITGKKFQGCPIERTGGVLWFAAEALDEVEPRLAALHKLGVMPRPAPFAYLGDVPVLSSHEGVTEFLDLIREGAKELQARFGVPLALVVVDTVAAAARWKEENSNSEAQSLFSALTAAAHQFDCAVALIDHLGKVSDRGTRGASAKDAASDARLLLVAEKGAGTAKLEKCRGSAARELGQYRLVSVDVPVGEDGETENVVAVQLDGSPSSPARTQKAATGRLLAAHQAVCASGRALSRSALKDAYVELGHKVDNFRRDVRCAAEERPDLFSEAALGADLQDVGEHAGGQTHRAGGQH